MEKQTKSFHKVIITGTDKKYQHYLPWWIHNVSKNTSSDVHIAIADFGMDSKWKHWARKQEVVKEWIDLPPPPPRYKGNTWFYKPITLLASKYESKVWIDIDCEILDNIDALFNFLHEGKISTCPDYYHSWGCKYQTGVFVTKSQPEILKKWAIECDRGVTSNRGDQEILWDVINRENAHPRISPIPEEYNWLRIALDKGKDIPNKKIIHWTGDRGKQVIAEKINEFNSLHSM